VLQRSDMFAHHHVQREPLSVRQRMSDVLASLTSNAFVDFVKLFRPDEGRRGVTVTFVAILELLREGLIEIVQSEPYGPLHVRPGNPTRHLKLVADEDAPAAANDPAAIAANDDTHDARTDAADGEAAVAANGDTNGPRADIDAAADGDATAAPGGANDDLARSQ
jgi:segregation and condensation protein A